MRLPLVSVLLVVSSLLAACGGDETPTAPRPDGPAPLAPPPESVVDTEARRAVALAKAAVEALPEDATLGLLLAREAARVSETPETREALHRALEAVRGSAPFRAHRGSTLTTAWSPDGELILTTSLDFDARLWTPQGEEVALLRGHGGKVLGGTFSPDGERILTWSVDHTARLWDRQGTLLHTLAGHTAELITAGFAPDGERILTVSLDGSAHLWSTEGVTLRRLNLLDSKDRVRAAHATRNEHTVELITVDGAHLTETALDDGDAVVEEHTLEGAAERLVVSKDGAHWVVLTDAAAVPLHDGGSAAMLRGHAAQALDAAFSTDGRLVATGSLDSTARLWDLEGQEVAAFEGHGGAVFSVAFSPDGLRVLTVSWDRTARLWDIEGNELAVFGSKALPLVAAAFSPDGTRILTRSYHAGPARLWDLQGHVLQTLPDDTGRTLTATFSPDGSKVLTLDRHLTPHVFAVEGTLQAVDAYLASTRDLTDDERRRYQELLRPGATVADEALDFAAARTAPDAGPARGDSAGTVACAACHREAYEEWVRSSHARTSFFAAEEVLPQDVLDGKTVEHPPGKTTFRKEGDRWIARTLGDDGQEQDFDLTMVSGHLRVRFFMTRMPDGRLQVLPAMYELPTGEWFDYTHLLFGAADSDFDTPPIVEPGSASFWTGPVRSWDARCAHCHMSGKSPVDPGPDGQGPRILARAYAVDCEACHGPARLHAEAWERLEMDETLEKLETWSREQKVALCTQCHQEGEVLHPPYVPGTDLYEYIDPTVVIDPERADPAGRPTELIYDGLPFAASHCANAGGLTCSDCHAPHGSATRSLLRKPHEDGALCVDCHQEIVANAAEHSHHQPTGTGVQCVPCHMPFLTIERGHGAVADHTIGIPRMGLVSDRVQTDACTWCHEGGLGAPTDAPMLAEEELWRAYEEWWPDRDWPRPWMAAVANARLGDADAGDALVAAIRDMKNPREARASAARLLGRYAATHADAIYAASHDFDSLVRRNALRAVGNLEGEKADARLLEALSDPSWAVRVVAARTALEGWTRVQANRELLEAVVAVLDRDARKVPDDDLRWFRLGAAYDLLGDKEKALEAYEQKARLDPYADQVRRHVKNLRALLGKDE